MPTKKVKVEFRNGWVFINGKNAKFFKPRDLKEIQREDSLLGDIGRVIYERDNILVKFDDTHWHQTMNEIKLWKIIDKKDKQYFCDILDWDKENYSWMAVRKEEIKDTDNLSKKNTDILIYLIEKYSLRDIFINFRNNRGTRPDGSLIVYDWGIHEYFKKTRRKYNYDFRKGF